MRLAILSLLSVVLSAAPVPVVQNQWYRLVAGTNSFTIGHSTDAVSCSAIADQFVVTLNSTWVRARVQFQQDYTNSTGTVDSANPATYCYDFTYGGIRIVYQQLDGSNNPVGAPSDPTPIYPQGLIVQQTGTITMPQTMVAFPGFQKSIVYHIPSGTLTGTTAFRAQVNNYSYFRKGSWQINNGNWNTFESCLSQTTLASDITSSTLTIPVTDATWIPTPNYIRIHNPTTGYWEQIYIISKSGNTLTAASTWRTLAGNGRGYKSSRVDGGQNQAPTTGLLNDLRVAHTAGEVIELADKQVLYGGVGGGFNSLTFTCALPTSTLTLGNNTINLRFDLSLDDSSGFRVLAMDLLSAAGSVLQDNSIVQEDPTTWTAPAGGTAATGKTLFQTATLKTPSVAGYTSLAHCGDCHSGDGRDLQYFAYDNNSLIVRSKFHQLTTQNGIDIAAYIRSLATADAQGNAVVAWGRPWNPPYQPGPGMSTINVLRWAAGAGLSLVLTKDRDMFGYLLPPYDGTGTISDSNAVTGFDYTASRSQQDVPIAMQIPDWNHWLPRIHPLDAWGATAWNASGAPAAYANIRSTVTPGSCSSYTTNAALWDTLAFDMSTWLEVTLPATGTQNSPVTQAQVYSNGLWELVKVWEIMQEYTLEGCYQTMYSSPVAAQNRGWRINRVPFDLSPNITKAIVQQDIRSTFSKNLTIPEFEIHKYLSAIWYNTQLILSSNSKHISGQSPNDWSYNQDFFSTQQIMSPGQAGNAALWYTSMMRSFKGNSSNATLTSPAAGPEIGSGGGWVAGDQEFRIAQPGYNRYIFEELTAAETSSILYGLLSNMITQAQTFTGSQWYAGAAVDGNIGNATYNAHCSGNNNAGKAWPDRFMWWLTVFQYFGVQASSTNMPTIVSTAVTWAASIWPDTDFSKINTTGSCSLSGAYDVQCTNWCVP